MIVDFAPFIRWLFSSNSNLSSALVALVQVNTGLFGVSVALLTIAPSLIEFVQEDSDSFVGEYQSVDKIDRALRFFWVAVLILGSTALLSAVMAAFPTMVGLIISFSGTAIGALLLVLGGRTVTQLTRDAL
ncbi:hypothetical protein [Halorientalis persicus]|jgi:hypothetical protein|uniref:hypothetical protein n=1 Tax=Halorientalis persicus TaxID=1367881 RepID=UPI0011137BD5|nr:hypothetical protein [Halorientalis persicus]